MNNNDLELPIPRSPSSSNRAKRTIFGFGIICLAALIFYFSHKYFTRPASVVTFKIRDSVVPMRKVLDGQPAISVEVNNAKAEFMVDTGCDVVVLSKTFADKLGLKTEPSTSGINQDKPGRKTTLDSLKIGETLVSNIDAEVADFKYADGIIGSWLLNKVIYGFDFPANTFYIHSKLPEKPGIPISFTYNKTPTHDCQVPYIKVDVQDQPVEIMLDTGAGRTSVSTVDFDRISSSTETVAAKAQSTDYLERPKFRDIRLLRNAKMDVGSMHMHISELVIGEFSESHKNILGMDVLAKFRLTIDPTQKIVWFEYTKDASNFPPPEATPAPAQIPHQTSAPSISP